MTASKLLNSEAAEAAAGLAAIGEPSAAEFKAALVNALRRIDALEKGASAAGRKKANTAASNAATSVPAGDPAWGHLADASPAEAKLDYSGPFNI